MIPRRCATAFLLALHGTLYAQWTPTQGPSGAFVNCLLAHVSTIFAGTENAGIYRSTDGGISWSPANSGLANAGVRAMAAQGAVVIAATAEGLFRSTDDGVSWSATGQEIPDTSFAAALAAPAGMLVATDTAGIFLSTDDGATWKPANVGLENVATISLAAHGSFLFAGTHDDGIFRSTDSGASWTEADSGITDFRIGALAASSSVIFAGSFAGDVFVSTNDGALWSTADPAPTLPGVLSLIADDQNLFAGMNSAKIYHSTDNGATWQHLGNGLTCGYAHALLRTATALLAGTDGGGVYRSTDGGANWSASSAGMNNAFVTNLAFSGSAFYACTKRAGFFVSTDNGVNWTDRSAGLDNSAEVNTVALQGANLLLGTQNAGVYISTDGGADWQTTAGPDNLDVHALTVRGTEVWAGTSTLGGIWKSTGGFSWQWMFDVASGQFWSDVQGIVFYGNRIVLGTGLGVVVSTDNGTDWNPEARMFDVYTLRVFGNLLYAGTFGCKVYVSADSGATWTLKSAGLTGGGAPGGAVTSFAANGSTLFASVGGSWNNGFAFPPDSGGVFISTNGGDHWSPVNTGLPERDVQSVRVNGTFAYAGLRSHGVWRRPLSDISTGVPGSEHAVPGSFALLQNYPNPFNPTTGIRYQVSGVSNVQLIVYDILGRQVATLVNERQAPGTYEVKFNGAGLSSGVYIYRLTAGRFTEARRMVLLK